MDQKIAFWKSLLDVYPDFPKPGVNFLDISPVLANPPVWDDMITTLAGYAWRASPTHVLGLDARGFLVGLTVAQKLKLPFVMARKPGKLPGPLLYADYGKEYGKEYGKDQLAIQMGSFGPGARVAVIDDILATGGSAVAAIDLVELDGAKTCFFGTLIDIAELDGYKVVYERTGLLSDAICPLMTF